MSVFNCNITYRRVEGDSFTSTHNRLQSQGFVDKYWNVTTDVATWRKARAELNQLAQDRLGFKDKINLFEEKKLLNGIRAVPNMKLFGMLDQLQKKAISSPVITPSDKIIFGHPGIGKTYVRETNPNIIDFDSDYKVKINEKYNIAPGFKALNAWRVDHQEEYKKEIRNLWKDAMAESRNSGKMLLASDMLLLREFEEDFDKVITIPQSTFIDRAKQRNDYHLGETEQWKSNLDKTIGAVDPSKIVTTDLYLSDLISNTVVSFEEIIDPIKNIYSSLGIQDGGVIPLSDVAKAQRVIDEYNSKDLGKELSLVAAKGGLMIKTEFKGNYLFMNPPQEISVTPNIQTDSNSDFNKPCL